MAINEELKNEILELKTQVAELKTILSEIQKDLKTTLMHTQGLYGKIDDIKR
jgi:archaellum component FlaC